jgi:hypothetical protein
LAVSSVPSIGVSPAFLTPLAVQGAGSPGMLQASLVLIAVPWASVSDLIGTSR